MAVAVEVDPANLPGVLGCDVEEAVNVLPASVHVRKERERGDDNVRRPLIQREELMKKKMKMVKNKNKQYDMKQ